MLRTNFLKQKLKAGKFVLGTWCVIPSVVTADIISKAGLDFLIIDSEHGPINFETAQNMVMACESNGVSPIMRVGNIDEADILKALDIGVHGIQVPNVSNVNDIDRIIQYAKYPPVGKRGFSPFTRAGNYSLASATSLTQTANENTLVAINVEGIDAIERIDEILKNEYLDIVFVGLFDISKALGIPGKVDDPKVIKLLGEIAVKVNAAGKYVGTIATDVNRVREFIDIGIKYIVYLVDCDVLRKGYSDVKDEFNQYTNKL